MTENFLTPESPPVDLSRGDGEAEIIACLAAGKPFVFDPATNFLHADDGTVDGGIRYAPVDQTLDFPRELTEELRDVFSTMLWTSGQIAQCLRAGGEVIKTRAEDEQAHVLHWMVCLALEHGNEWRAKASDRIREIQASVKAAASEGAE